MFLHAFDPGTGGEVEDLHELVAVEGADELLELRFVLKSLKSASQVGNPFCRFELLAGAT